MIEKIYYVYIMASESGVLYIGMTSDLARRVYEHQNELIEGFTRKYKCKKLVYFEYSNDVLVVLEREKQLKRWSRAKKLFLIRTENPNLEDLSTALEMTTREQSELGVTEKSYKCTH